MKFSAKLSRILLTATVLIIELATGAYAQDGLFLDNTGNTSTNSAASSNGLFWVSVSGTPVLITNDFNAAFYGGTNATNLTLLGTFLLSDATANFDNVVGPGFFFDPFGVERIITDSTNWAFIKVQAWFGTNTSYAAAAAAGDYAGQSTVFSNAVAGPPNIPPDLTSMPAVVLTAGGEGGSVPISGGGGGSSSGGGSPSGPSGPLNVSGRSSCGLVLSIAASNSTTVELELSGVRTGQTYYVYGNTNLLTENWVVETNFIASTKPTLIAIAMKGRSDLFFRAAENGNVP